MRIQPRQQLLEIWRATAEAAYPLVDGKRQWQWGGREGPNSISDAEQLLCLMFPATEIERFRIGSPNQTEDDVLVALKPLGGAIEIPQVMITVLTDYLTRYSDEDGSPIFSGGSLFTPINSGEHPVQEQRDLDVVESYAASITLMLATLGFVKELNPQVSRPEVRAQLDKLEGLANLRLSAAMVGLLRSFSVYVFPIEGDYADALLRTVNQGLEPRRKIVADLREALKETAAGLRDLTAGLRDMDEIERPDRFFECGWSWGVTQGKEEIPWVTASGKQREGVALDAPYLYFTVVALDGISDLFTERTRLQGLLDEEQVRLSAALRLRWELTQKYWSTIASLGAGRWPLEDIPWRTVDGVESDYFSLLVTSIAARDLTGSPNDGDLSRLGEVLKELANRARITRRPTANDPALALHTTGVRIDLDGTDTLGPALSWVAVDFAQLLLKRVIRVASLINRVELRAQLLHLADQVWSHVAQRRMIDEMHGPGLWDQPASVYDRGLAVFEQPSWHHTVRVVEALVNAAGMAGSHPLRSEKLIEFTQDLLAEAEHLFDQELLIGATERGPAMRVKLETVRQQLRRAREITADRPGSAVALLLSVLRDLDGFQAARQDVLGAS
ncbi:hypothetical protein F4553_005091 [Allocatelliglobosispora scoriae]|uniref:Uncharacterized protein n=1 Tax=Allocatelliglobosispora scoriae TaxID=643052 RepID=A0A841BY48_9ACTN|nr:SCO2524 family protein [Allocatelliglobosispora scoriae]MBB5871712.1 hypothetical protein [Allocatelliglobosispora scoriae]